MGPVVLRRGWRQATGVQMLDVQKGIHSSVTMIKTQQVQRLKPVDKMVSPNFEALQKG